jgi:hypothetical protein
LIDLKEKSMHQASVRDEDDDGDGLCAGNPDFALVDEAYPYISRRLLTDPSPRLREALRYMVYGKSNVFDAGKCNMPCARNGIDL